MVARTGIEPVFLANFDALNINDLRIIEVRTWQRRNIVLLLI